jgi:hypothetical protein
MKKLIYFIIIINLNLFLSCNSKKKFSGNYISKGEIYLNLELKQDSTFNFESKYHLDHTKGNGSWKYIDKNIILNSKKIDDVIVTEDYNLKLDNNIISINTKEYNDEKYKYILISLVINDKETFEFINKENIIFKGEIKKLSLYYNQEKFTYYPKKSSNNSISILLDFYDSNKFYFKNEKIIVRKNKIILGKNILYKK